MLLAAIRGGINSLMAELLEAHIRLHTMHPAHRTESPEELTEDLISLVRAYLKWSSSKSSNAGRSTPQNQKGQPGAPEAVPQNPPG